MSVTSCQSPGPLWSGGSPCRQAAWCGCRGHRCIPCPERGGPGAPWGWVTGLGAVGGQLCRPTCHLLTPLQPVVVWPLSLQSLLGSPAVRQSDVGVFPPLALCCAGRRHTPFWQCRPPSSLSPHLPRDLPSVPAPSSSPALQPLMSVLRTCCPDPPCAADPLSWVPQCSVPIPELPSRLPTARPSLTLCLLLPAISALTTPSTYDHLSWPQPCPFSIPPPSSWSMHSSLLAQEPVSELRGAHSRPRTTVVTGGTLQTTDHGSSGAQSALETGRVWGLGLTGHGLVTTRLSVLGCAAAFTLPGPGGMW
nr:uncharacterized protein LOC112424570 isoform X1 [Macaca nemestrina]XP_024644860.1 uncharacterized protein LOC112424570 isoform X2 [Macaca nemestrina]